MAFDHKFRRKKQPYTPNTAFIKIPVFISKKTKQILEEKGFELRERVSRLVAIAIDNELASDPPFRYDAEMPTVEYVENQYSNEAGKILRFLEKFPTGASLTSLLLCKRDIGILSKAQFMLGFRELIKVDLIEEFKPQSAFARRPGYTEWRPTQIDPKTGEKFENQDEI
jgi:hypothetical protein